MRSTTIWKLILGEVLKIHAGEAQRKGRLFDEGMIFKKFLWRFKNFGQESSFPNKLKHAGFLTYLIMATLRY